MANCCLGLSSNKYKHKYKRQHKSPHRHSELPLLLNASVPSNCFEPCACTSISLANVLMLASLTQESSLLSYYNSGFGCLTREDGLRELIPVPYDIFLKSILSFASRCES